MARKVLTDELWEKLKILLPKPKGRHGNDDRLFIESVCWIIRTGAPWRDLPQEFGSWKTVDFRHPLHCSIQTIPTVGFMWLINSDGLVRCSETTPQTFYYIRLHQKIN
jgi:transposase